MTSANTTLRRLMKEAQELSASSSSPSPHFHAHPISDSNLFEWHFTLAGPPAPSPYANGIYHGRIVLPSQYPLRPPSFRFLTPSGRFEVNREICLSISGHHDESWQPAWGIRTALTAIRSFMDGDAKGQVGGLDATDEVRREWAKRSREWVCSACSDGRSNASVLEEWWDVCRNKGVNVGGDEDRAAERREGSGEAIPVGLKLSYRDELGAASKGTASSNPVPNETPAEQSAAELPRGNSGASSAGNTAQSSGISSTATSTTATGISSPAPASHEGPWLDRAIMGVLIALAAIILKKIIYARSMM